jgi:hypothetical protein
MPQPAESLRDKMIVAAVQTLIFGVLLALFGFWLNLRLESYKSELALEAERLKAVMALSEPLTRERRSAYIEFQHAGREILNVVTLYYHLGKNPSPDGNLFGKVQALREEMGIGSGTTSATWVTKEEVADALSKLAALRHRHKDLTSRDVGSAVENLLDTAIEDLRKAQERANNTAAFHTTARTRLHEAAARFEHEVNKALRTAELPIQ